MAQRKARSAHNREDLGSKPSAGIFQFVRFQKRTVIAKRRKTSTHSRYGAAV